ncbi:MAG: hypothetical protein BGO03_17170 [Mesorhizobium sp. 61-13]|nr:MAG: hypothetical protein BGO03_17170 [Mesorhizobium sp. 61-13]
MTDFSPILVQTCEDDAAGRSPRALVPREEQHHSLFEFDDPFGVRRAVLPVLHVGRDGDLQGYGSCLAADPWGTLLTADHVVESMRAFRADEGFVALLGIGVAFGTPPVPNEGIAPIVRAFTPAIPDDNPLNVLRGNDRPRPLDIAVLRTRDPQPENMAGTLPIRLRSGPRVGDTVIALGFPYVDTIKGNADEVRSIISEGGLQAAYGVVTALHPKGRDRSNPTPVFEVEAHWPSGMSGGPVLNSSGEVIGLVSRALDPMPGQFVGTAWGVWLEALPQLINWAPTLDPENPKWRRCHAIREIETGNIISLFPTRESAEGAQANDPFSEVVTGISRVGSSDFLSMTIIGEPVA